ncbi:MAG TPA: DNA-deoxyinosine glycosylase, partial [Ruminococcaceae bacterium]|nr:DNA-deoxyinosine glycosylase [Oscillospiraceae bacterium]
MSENARVTHPFPPLFNSESDTLILGSFPSVK